MYSGLHTLEKTEDGDSTEYNDQVTACAGQLGQVARNAVEAVPSACRQFESLFHSVTTMVQKRDDGIYSGEPVATTKYDLPSGPAFLKEHYQDPALVAAEQDRQRLVYGVGSLVFGSLYGAFVYRELRERHQAQLVQTGGSIDQA